MRDNPGANATTRHAAAAAVAVAAIAQGLQEWLSQLLMDSQLPHVVVLQTPPHGPAVVDVHPTGMIPNIRSPWLCDLAHVADRVILLSHQYFWIAAQSALCSLPCL